MATCIMHYGIKNHRFKSVREGILAIFLTSMNFIFDTAQSQVFFLTTVENSYLLDQLSCFQIQLRVVKVYNEVILPQNRKNKKY